MDLAKAKPIILSIAILIVATAFIFYAIDIFYSSPDYEDFCPMEKYSRMIMTKADCDDIGGFWNYNTGPCPAGEKCPEGYCDPHYTCRKDYEAKNQEYNRNVFIASIIAGSAILVVGLVLKVAVVSNGLMLAGSLTLIIGVLRYWSELSKVLKVAILAAVLTLLIWISYKKFKKA